MSQGLWTPPIWFHDRESVLVHSHKMLHIPWSGITTLFESWHACSTPSSPFANSMEIWRSSNSLQDVTGYILSSHKSGRTKVLHRNPKFSAVWNTQFRVYIYHIHIQYIFFDMLMFNPSGESSNRSNQLSKWWTVQALQVHPGDQILAVNGVSGNWEEPWSWKSGKGQVVFIYLFMFYLFVYLFNWLIFYLFIY